MMIKMESLKIIIVAMILSSVLVCCVLATTHIVGGATGWDPMSDLMNWSSNTTFFTWDKLEFIYGPDHDVLEVDREAYLACDITNPITSFYDDGKTVITLNDTGMWYFICGTPGHCRSGLRVRVDVLPLPDSRRRSPSRPVQPSPPEFPDVPPVPLRPPLQPSTPQPPISPDVPPVPSRPPLQPSTPQPPISPDVPPVPLYPPTESQIPIKNSKSTVHCHITSLVLLPFIMILFLKHII